MKLEEAMRGIESKNFSALMGLANNAEMFRDLARSDQFVMWLLEALSSSEEQLSLLRRIISLLTQQDDVRFRSSSDAAIAVYVWCLEQKSPALARLAATYILGSPRLWWARKVALQFMGGMGTSRPLEHGMVGIEYVVTDTPIKANLTTDSSETLSIPTPPKELGDILRPSAVKIESGNEKVVSSTKEVVSSTNGTDLTENLLTGTQK